MGEIVRIGEHAKRREAYRRQCREARRLLEVAEEKIATCALNLACADRWREWNETVPSGTVMPSPRAALRDCGDPRVAALVDVVEAVERALEVLEG